MPNFAVSKERTEVLMKMADSLMAQNGDLV